MKRSTRNNGIDRSRDVAVLTPAQLGATRGGALSDAPTPVPWPPGPTAQTSAPWPPGPSLHRNTIVLDQ